VESWKLNIIAVVVVVVIIIVIFRNYRLQRTKSAILTSRTQISRCVQFITQNYAVIHLSCYGAFLGESLGRFIMHLSQYVSVCRLSVCLVPVPIKLGTKNSEEA